MPDGSRDLKEQTLAAQAVEAASGGASDEQVRAAEHVSTSGLAFTAPATIHQAAPFYVPGDSLFGDQWYLDNTGQSGGTAGIDLNITGVWDDYTGAGVTIGVVDSGIQFTHPDLDGNYDTSIDWDVARNVASALPVFSGDNHGTAVGGVIAAENDGVGTVGVAFDATLAGFRMDFNNNWSLAQPAEAFARQINVDISNNSWGFTWYFADNKADPAFASVFGNLQHAAEAGRGGLGTVFVFAAGNSRIYGDNVNYHNLQNSPYTIAVAAHDDHGNVESYSTPGAALLVSAGSGNVTTTDRTGSSGYDSTDYETGLAGTSFSAPQVSGVVALMLEANPDLGARDVQEILAYSATRIQPGNADWQFNGATNWNGGGLHTSTDVGFGAVDALAAVRLAETWSDQHTFANDRLVTATKTTNVAIGDLGTVSTSIDVLQGLDIDHVELRVQGTHSWFGDLVFTLTSPDGTSSTLADLPNSYWLPSSSSNVFDWTFSSTQFWGETGIGTWTLTISDGLAGDSGTLSSWQLRLYGDTLDFDDIYFFTDEYAGFTGPGDAGRRVLSDSSGSDTINLATLTTAVVLDLTPGASSTIAGNAFAIDAGTVIETAYGGDGDDAITGNSADNVLSGARGDDTLGGGSGNDVLIGGAGNDVLDGGSGDDTVRYLGNISDYMVSGLGGGAYQFSNVSSGEGTDTLIGIEFVEFLGGDGVVTLASLLPNPITGTAGDDVLVGTAAHDLIFGLAGNDTLSGGSAGSDLLDGGEGSDWANYEAAGSGVTANLADQGMNSGAAAGDRFVDIENLRGSAFADVLVGDAGVNALEGGDGDDILEGGAGADSLIGGAGTDTASYLSASSGVTANLQSPGANTGDAAGDVYTGIENLTGSAFNDTLAGDANDNVISGGDGVDTVVLAGTLSDYAIADLGPNDLLLTDNGNGGGVDRLVGIEFLNFLGDGSTVSVDQVPRNVVGTAGDDTLIGAAGNDTLSGGDGNDVLVGKAGADDLDGGAGEDTASYVNASAGVVANLASAAGNTGDATGDTYTEIENLSGSDHADTLTGDSSANTLSGGGGNDTVSGGGGNDTLVGGAGDDIAVFAGSLAEYTITHNLDGSISIADSVVGRDGTDILLDIEFASFDQGSVLTALSSYDGLSLVGTSGNDVIGGGAGNDIIDGSGGNDDIHGFAGDDYLIGGDGRDVLKGRAGNDVLYGGARDDLIFGGHDVLDESAGLDVAVYEGNRIDYQINELLQGDVRIIAKSTHEGTDTLFDIDYLNFLGGDGLVAVSDILAEVREGSDEADLIRGSEGDDLLTGGGGDDTIIGNGGNDLIDGGEGTDTARFAGNFADYQITYLGNGQYQLVNTANGFETDILEGVESVDFYEDIGPIPTIALTGNIVLGTSNAETITGTAGVDFLRGGPGNDTVYGGEGNDVLFLPGFNTFYRIGLMSDGGYRVETRVWENEGTDLVYDVESAFFISEGEIVPLSELAERNEFHGRSGNDTYYGGIGNDKLFGGSGNDRLYGEEGEDRLYGDHGNDVLVGGEGNDYLEGRAGNDRLFGSEGDDEFWESLGNDTIDGGPGFDIVNYGLDFAFFEITRNSDGTVRVHDTTGYYDTDTLENVELLSFPDGDYLVGDLFTVNGTSAADTLVGTSLDDKIAGLAGQDRLTGGGGNDTLDGGGGIDVATYDGNASRYTVADLGGGKYEIVDTLGLLGTDSLGGIELLYFGGGDGYVSIEQLAGGSGASFPGNTLTGDNSSDVLVGGNGDDTLNGNAGNDRIDGGMGDDTIDGGAGIDTAVYTTFATTGSVYTDYSIQRIGSDSFQIVDNVGVQGTDTLLDIENIDIDGDIRSVAEWAVIRGFGNGVTLTGTEWDDMFLGAAGADLFSGGNGSDAVSYANAGGAVTASLTGAAANTGDAAGDTYTGIEGLIGSNYGDRLTGDGGDNRLDGGAGDDTLDGGLGNDTISGGAGYDTLMLDGSAEDFTFTKLGRGSYLVTDNGSNAAGDQGTKQVDGVEGVQFSDGTPAVNLYQVASAWRGGSGADTAEGGGALDMLYGGDGDDTLDGGTGADVLVGGSGNDALYGRSGRDTLFGNGGDDGLYGGSGHDHMVGGDGNDILRGASGDDTLRGGDGDDLLYGDAGDDLLAGGHGADWLYGGAGNDSFVFRSGDGDDTISGFAAGAGSDDVVDVSDFNYADFTTLLGDIAQVGGDAVLQTASGDTLTFAGIDRGDLHQDDFAL